jgi:hypothetical protein
VEIKNVRENHKELIKGEGGLAKKCFHKKVLEMARRRRWRITRKGDGWRQFYLKR